MTLLLTDKFLSEFGARQEKGSSFLIYTVKFPIFSTLNRTSGVMFPQILDNLYVPFCSSWTITTVNVL